MSKKLQKVVFSEDFTACPTCKRQAKRHSHRTKTLLGLRGVVYEVTSSVHFCPAHRFFTNIGSEYRGKTYAEEVRREAVRVFHETDRQKDVVPNVKKATGLEIPLTTIYEWIG